ADAVRGGMISSCAVPTDRTGWCWGKNHDGQLGTGQTTATGPNLPTPINDAGQPPPTIVSLGDSFISGEGGRWAGNTNDNQNTWRIDALGPHAYYDNDAD